MSFDVAKWNKKRYLAEANISEEGIVGDRSVYDQCLDIVIDYLRKANGADAAAYLEKMRNYITNTMIAKVQEGQTVHERFFSQAALDAAYNKPKSEPLDFTNKSDEEVKADFIKLVDDQDYWTSIMADFRPKEYDAKDEVIKVYRKELANRGLDVEREEIEDRFRKKYLF